MLRITFWSIKTVLSGAALEYIKDEIIKKEDIKQENIKQEDPGTKKAKRKTSKEDPNGVHANLGEYFEHGEEDSEEDSDSEEQ